MVRQEGWGRRCEAEGGGQDGVQVGEGKVYLIYIMLFVTFCLYKLMDALCGNGNSHAV